MWKKHALAAVIGVAMFVMPGSSNVIAQPFGDRPDGPRQPPLSREDAIAYVEARIAALHAGLQLTPEQERIWPPFEQAYRDMVKLRTERAAAGGSAAPGMQDPVSRLQGRADALIQQGTVLKRLADASAPLWRSFDEAQKRRFVVLARPANLQAGLGRTQPDDFPDGTRRNPDQYGLGLDRSDDRGGRDDDGFGRRGARGIDPGGPVGRNGDDYGSGPEPRGWGPGGPPGRDGEHYGYRSGPQGIGPDRRPSGREGDRDGSYREPRRLVPGPERDFSREQGRDPDRGRFRWWRGPAGIRPGDMAPGRGWREGREPAEPNRDFRGSPARERNGRSDYDEERL
jgi:zinc resistance-associated protein